MNGPSVIRVRPPSTRTVVAVSAGCSWLAPNTPGVWAIARYSSTICFCSTSLRSLKRSRASPPEWISSMYFMSVLLERDCRQFDEWTTAEGTAGRPQRGDGRRKQSEVLGISHRLGAVGRAELGEDVTGVLLDRLERHDEFVGNAAVALARGDQAENFKLPSGEGLDEPRRRRSRCLLSLRPERGDDAVEAFLGRAGSVRRPTRPLSTDRALQQESHRGEAHSALGFGDGLEAIEQLEGQLGASEEDPRQDEVAILASVDWIILPVGAGFDGRPVHHQCPATLHPHGRRGVGGMRLVGSKYAGRFADREKLLDDLLPLYLTEVVEAVAGSQRRSGSAACTSCPSSSDRGCPFDERTTAEGTAGLPRRGAGHRRGPGQNLVSFGRIDVDVVRYAASDTCWSGLWRTRSVDAGFR